MEDGFEKRFSKGDIVYFHRQIGNKHEVELGMVDEQFSDAVCIDRLERKENRFINGIALTDFPSITEYKKLPKGWSWDTVLFELIYDDTDDKALRNCKIDNPEAIKQAFKDGLLVKSDTKFQGVIDTEINKEGYRIKKSYPMWSIRPITHMSIRPDRCYFTYQEALDKVNNIKREIERQASLTDLEWSMEQIDKTLNRYASIYSMSNNDIEKYRKWLLEMKNIEDLDTRIWDGEIQWKYEKKKKWNNICL